MTRTPIPACPDCGAGDTCENRQGGAFRALIAEIDGSTSLTEFAAIGERLYAPALEHDAAGVAGTYYRFAGRRSRRRWRWARGRSSPRSSMQASAKLPP